MNVAGTLSRQLNWFQHVVILRWMQFKHCNTQGPQSLQVNGQCIVGTSIIPATLLRELVQYRDSRQAVLFAYADGTPMLRSLMLE